MNPSRKIITIIGYLTAGISVLLFAAMVKNIVKHPDCHMWDFKTYFYAAKAEAGGLDPYKLESLSASAGKEISLKYVYPPLTVMFFKMFLLFKYDTAYNVYLALKVTVLLLLILVWVRYFVGIKELPLFLIFTLLSFKSTVYVDLMTGNISIFEQLFLWSAFAFFIKKRYGCFTALIILAAQFKVLPAYFLILLLAADDVGKYRRLALSVLAFTGIFLLNYIIKPGFFVEYLISAGGIDERGFLNPSLLALMKDAAKPAGFGSKTAYIIYSLLAAGAAALTAFILSRSRHKQNHYLVLYTAIALYCVVAPRLKDYSYIVLIVPSYYMLRALPNIYFKILMLFIFAFVGTSPVPFLKPFFPPLNMSYYLYMLAVLVWIYFMIAAWKGNNGENTLP